jgi:AcrR family transcriptional regulator
MTAEDRLPLLERKRLQARGRIVDAAEQLFSEHGFNAVSVADIADRAEVGRTTFFRYFGDKQEVVFAQEQELIAMLATAHQQSASPTPDGPEEAIRQLREIVLELCDQATKDPVSYTRHFDFIRQNAELIARDALKMQQFAARLAEILVARGADEDLARLAAQIALACYQTGKARHGNDPRSLVTGTRWAFDEVLGLESADRRSGAGRRDRRRPS